MRNKIVTNFANGNNGTSLLLFELIRGKNHPLTDTFVSDYDTGNMAQLIAMDQFQYKTD